MASIMDCRVSHYDNPIGYDLTPLRVSWKVEGATGKHPRWSRVRVANNPEMTGELYDSGEAGLNSLATPIPLELAPYSRYYWQVEVETDADEVLQSEVQYFETAKQDDPWQADWIGCTGLETNNPVFERVISCAAPMGNARLYICGLGVYEVYLNGVRVGEEYLAPGCHDYNMWLQYQTYPVSLKSGDNLLRISLGNGWYRGRFGMTAPTAFYGKDFALIAELRQQGEFICGTDCEWSVRACGIVENGLYDGETFAPGRAEIRSVSAEVMNLGKERLRERLSPPVTIHEEIRPVSRLVTPKGELVLDMGQNFAGTFRMKVNLPKDSTLKLQFGEILQDGCFYNDNLRTAKAEYVYISDGESRVLQPSFTYYGYRYVKVEGLPELELEDFTGLALYSDLQQTGWLETSDEKINRLIDNVIWGQKSNYVDVPTDCPQRDERLGWTADAQVFAGTACFNMDSYAFLNKYLADIDATIREKGMMTSIIPAFDCNEPTSCGWGDAATIIPWTLYQFYGDIAILSQHYDSMKFWTDYMHKQDPGDGLWHADSGFGDWLAKDHDNPNERFAGGTELMFLASAHYYYSTMIVAQAAEILDKREDAVIYRERAAAVKAAFLNEYYTPAGRLAVTTQTAYIIALAFGLVPEGRGSAVAAALSGKLKNGGNTLKTGFLGTPWICRVLSKYGYIKQAYQLLFNEGVPSWLYAVNLGATTVWERWDSLLPDGHINGTDMNSFNHYSYGSVLEWMYRDIAGLEPDMSAPGFKRVRFAPKIDTRLKNVRATYNAPAGTYHCGWEILDDGKIHVSLTVPFDASAEILLPMTSGEIIHVDAGKYEYTYTPDVPLFKKVTTYDPFIELRRYAPAKPLLEQYVPGYDQIPDSFCDISLREMSKTPFMQISDEILDRIDDALITDRT